MSVAKAAVMVAQPWRLQVRLSGPPDQDARAALLRLFPDATAGRLGMTRR